MFCCCCLIFSLSNLFKFQMNVLTTPTLLETCPYSEFFWSVFSRIRTEYGETSLRIQSKFRKKWTRKTPNTDTFYAKLIQKLNFNKLDKSKLFTNEADWSVSCIWTVIFFIVHWITWTIQWKHNFMYVFLIDFFTTVNAFFEVLKLGRHIFFRPNESCL